MSQNDEKPETATEKSEEELDPWWSNLSFLLISTRFEKEFGHGWKRRLAKVAGVSDSTVHGWVKAERMPALISKMFGLEIDARSMQRKGEAIVKKIDDFQRTWKVVEAENGFSVYRFEDGIGHIVAMGIPDIETAREIAALPRLKSLSAKLSGMLNELFWNQVVPENWFDDEEKKPLEEVKTWSIPPTLDVDMSDPEGLGEDLNGALEALTIYAKEIEAKSK